MLSPRWRKVINDLLANKTRTLLVLLSIAVGVMTIGSILSTQSILNRETFAIYESVNPADATLVVNEFQPTLLDEISTLDSVETVEARRSVNLSVPMGDGEMQDITLFVLRDYADIRLNKITSTDGEYPPQSGEILMERSALAYLGMAVGDTLTIETPAGAQIELPITGEVYDVSQPAANVLQVAYGYINEDTLLDLGEEGGFNQLYITVAEKGDDQTHIKAVADEVRQTIEKNGGIVFTTLVPTPGEPPGYMFVRAFLITLIVVGGFSFLLSGFLIINIITSVMTQQTKQIGVMKTFGAKTGSIISMYLVKVGIYGLLALIIGIPVSVLGTRALATAFGNLLNYEITDFSAPVEVYFVQIVLGLAVPVIAAAVPVISGTRVSVLDALNTQTSDGANQGIIERFFSRVRGLPRPILLSLRNTFRRKGQLTLTLLTLMLAGAIFAAVFSLRDSLFNTLDESVAVEDYDVELIMQDAYPRDELVNIVTSVEGVTEAEAWITAIGRYQLDGDVPSDDIQLVGLPSDKERYTSIMKAGRWLKADDTNAVVINGNLLQNYADNGVDVAVGDEISLTVRGQTTTWEVVGIVRSFFSFELIAYTPYETLATTIGEEGLARALRMTTAEHSAEYQTKIATTLSEDLSAAGYRIQTTGTTEEFKASLDTRIASLVGFLLILALILAVVGGLGIASTTSINVIERVREIGVMRAIGASDGSVLRVFITESVFVGLIGWLVGALFALPIGYALSYGVGIAFTNAPLSYQYSIFGAGIWLALALIMAVISSYLPARRATKLSLQEVLNYE